MFVLILVAAYLVAAMFFPALVLVPLGAVEALFTGNPMAVIVGLAVGGWLGIMRQRSLRKPS